jgi:hypothetical protein
MDTLFPEENFELFLSLCEVRLSSLNHPKLLDGRTRVPILLQAEAELEVDLCVVRSKH